MAHGHTQYMQCSSSGKQYFRECCTELGINCDALFILGAQEHSKKTLFRFDLPASTHRDGQRFAVNYIKSLELYLVWCLSEDTDKHSFYFPREKLLDYEYGSLVFAEPSSAPRRNTEKAYAFGRESVRRFLMSFLVNG